MFFRGDRDWLFLVGWVTERRGPMDGASGTAPDTNGGTRYTHGLVRVHGHHSREWWAALSLVRMGEWDEPSLCQWPEWQHREEEGITCNNPESSQTVTPPTLVKNCVNLEHLGKRLYVKWLEFGILDLSLCDLGKRQNHLITILPFNNFQIHRSSYK